jgi:hypothetical protein
VQNNIIRNQLQSGWERYLTAVIARHVIDWNSATGGDSHNQDLRMGMGMRRFMRKYHLLPAVTREVVVGVLKSSGWRFGIRVGVL